MKLELTTRIEELASTHQDIPEDRKALLIGMANDVTTSLSKDQNIAINVICTHNSRRSQFGQIWIAMAAKYLGLKNVTAYSGGTEETAFHPNAVASLKRFGLDVSCANPNDKNPRYEVTYADDMKPLVQYSKQYNDEANPQQDFFALIVCSSADQNCPMVHGAKKRFFLPYEDPKRSDGQSNVIEIYDTTFKTIGREILFLFAQIKNSLEN